MEDKRTCDIGGGLALVEAEAGEFARFHALYRTDPFMRDEEELMNLFCEGTPCWWIYSGDARVGGCVAGGGVLGQLFTIPPFERKAEALRRVVGYLRGIDSRRVFAHGIMMEELDDYFRLGFRLTASVAPSLLNEEPDYSWQFMRAMARPVGGALKLPCTAQLRAPRKADAARIAKLLAAAYGLTDPMRQDDEAFRKDVADYFLQGDRAMRAASSLASSGGQLLGVCLVVRWEGTPLVFDIAVHPVARSGGIARAMIARALESLHESGERKLRLFVECGNPAESLYHAMGFRAGPKTTSMILE